MSTIPAIVQVVFGYLVGVFIRNRGEVDWLWAKVPQSQEPHFKLLSGLFVTGFILLVLAWTWSLGFPINKKIMDKFLCALYYGVRDYDHWRNDMVYRGARS
ncbi:hypothetical protein [Sphingobacterium sp. T2]|uniref:hypothetical protein n=1 Tax=Sphingobacterium sp. T2 TaxID=1590596 RepID=UPI000B1230DA|nr:hypothetical protein [Sphingobacterium sp. T2]